ncbi:MAG: caspase family protein [Cypionkella sp.]
MGIDDYEFFEPFDPNKPVAGHTDLQGAAADATVIGDALRSVGVDLPDNRFLTNRNATLAAFKAGWDEVIAKAAPGDRLFVSFAGHGGQEEEIAPPIDEKDGLDETIMFADFNPDHPREGRLNDDQLHELLASAPQLQIIWVMDSCHSGGLERSVNASATGLSRSGGKWKIPIDPLPGELPSGAGETGQPDLPNVTQILATATDDRLVNETTFEGQPHGALSWYFAKAILGEADSDQDGNLTRLELASYIGDRVFTHMEQNQQPRFLPRGDPSVMLSLHAAPPPPPVVDAGLLPVKFEGAPPPGLTEQNCPGCRVVDQGQELTFHQQADGWAVFSGQGDLTTVLQGDAVPQVIRRKFLLDLNEAKVPTLPTITLHPRQSAARQPIGARVGFDAPPPSAELAYLTLFNLASDGSVQYGLYPAGFSESKPATQGLSLVFDVAPPTGEDQLVVIWCKRPPLALHALLAQANGHTVPSMSDVIAATADTQCQFGRIGLFTEG